jgi:hypothetical protein
VCILGHLISKRILRDTQLSYKDWNDIPLSQLYLDMTNYPTFSSMVKSLSLPEARSAVDLLRSKFAGHLGPVGIEPQEVSDVDFLTEEGVLMKLPDESYQYRMSSALVDVYLRINLIPLIYPFTPPGPPPLRGNHELDIVVLLQRSVACFDPNFIANAVACSYKRPKVNVRGVLNTPVPRESVYENELMRILKNWLCHTHKKWTVTAQWHLQNEDAEHKFCDIVIRENGSPPVVLELLATGERGLIMSHIKKTREYMRLLSAQEGWVIHFTCEDNFNPIWQPDGLLTMGLNVLHFWHDQEFRNVKMSGRWKDSVGRVCEELDVVIMP